jgi:hypothetical protein
MFAFHNSKLTKIPLRSWTTEAFLKYIQIITDLLTRCQIDLTKTRAFISICKKLIDETSSFDLCHAVVRVDSKHQHFFVLTAKLGSKKMFRPGAIVVLLILASALQAYGLKSSNCTFQRQPIAAPGKKITLRGFFKTEIVQITHPYNN